MTLFQSIFTNQASRGRDSACVENVAAAFKQCYSRVSIDSEWLHYQNTPTPFAYELPRWSMDTEERGQQTSTLDPLDSPIILPPRRHLLSIAALLNQVDDDQALSRIEVESHNGLKRMDQTYNTRWAATNALHKNEHLGFLTRPARINVDEFSDNTESEVDELEDESRIESTRQNPSTQSPSSIRKYERNEKVDPKGTLGIQIYRLLDQVSRNNRVPSTPGERTCPVTSCKYHCTPIGQRNYTSHLNTHLPTAAKVCPDCGMTLSTGSNLSRHDAAGCGAKKRPRTELVVDKLMVWDERSGKMVRAKVLSGWKCVCIYYVVSWLVMWVIIHLLSSGIKIMLEHQTTSWVQALVGEGCEDDTRANRLQQFE